MKIKNIWFVLLFIIAGILFLLPLMVNGFYIKDATKTEIETGAIIKTSQDSDNILQDIIKQWYIDNCNENVIFLSDNSWAFDERKPNYNVEVSPQNIIVKNKNREVTIALIDAYINYDLFQNDNNLLINPEEINNNHVDDDNNGFIDDYYGYVIPGDYEGEFSTHGTKMMSILLGSNYFKEYIGMLDHSKCYVLGISAISNSSSDNDIVNAIEYAEYRGAEICCMPFDTYIFSKKIRDKMKESNMLFIVPAGNDGVELGKDIDVYPAMYNLENVIVVADCRLDGNLSYTSNFSKNYVDVMAPGTDIATLIDADTITYCSGTSCATTIASAVCGIILSQDKTKIDELKDYICKKIEDKDGIIRYGPIHNIVK